MDHNLLYEEYTTVNKPVCRPVPVSKCHEVEEPVTSLVPRQKCYNKPRQVNYAVFLWLLLVSENSRFLNF